MLLLDHTQIKWLVLHTSASPYGDTNVIDVWHREMGFERCGYHHVICNCYPSYESWTRKQPELAYDGLVQEGRSEQFQGAHVKGHNCETIGVCMIGENGQFSSRQLESAARLCYKIMDRYSSIAGVMGHYEFPTSKTCPDLDMGYFRQYILPAYSPQYLEVSHRISSRHAVDFG